MADDDPQSQLLDALGSVHGFRGASAPRKSAAEKARQVRFARGEPGITKDPAYPVELAYWFFRLNGFFTITNFLLHPPRRGGLRTDADIVGVRYPARREYAMTDHQLFEGSPYMEFVVAEVKTHGPCLVNGPWTDPQRQNIEHLLCSLGMCYEPMTGQIAACLYESGDCTVQETNARYRMIAIAERRNEDLAQQLPAVTQLVWDDILAFIHARLGDYRNQKRNNDSWPAMGRQLYAAAVSQPLDLFVRTMKP